MSTAPKWLKVQTLNLARMLPVKVPTWPQRKIRVKGVGHVTWPHFWALNVKTSKIAKCSHIKFGKVSTWLLKKILNRLIGSF